MHASSNTDLSYSSQEHSTLKSVSNHVYKFGVSKSKSTLSGIKSKWLHLNGDDPEVSSFGLVALVIIALLVGASFYVSFLDGWFRQFWFLLTGGGA